MSKTQEKHAYVRHIFLDNSKSIPDYNSIIPMSIAFHRLSWGLPQVFFIKYMSRAIAFVDGFNLHHGIAENLNPYYKWLDIKSLIRTIIPLKISLTGVYYFSAYCTWKPDKYERHKKYVKALISTGVKPIFGKFKERTRTCRVCGNRYIAHEEKRTDVNIAIFMLRFAFEGKFDTAVLVSGDSDLVPAMNMIKQKFPDKKIIVLFPPERYMADVHRAGTSSYTIRPKHIRKNGFPDEIDLGNGKKLTCPEEWIKSAAAN